MSGLQNALNYIIDLARCLAHVGRYRAAVRARESAPGDESSINVVCIEVKLLPRLFTDGVCTYTGYRRNKGVPGIPLLVSRGADLQYRQ